MRRGVCSGSIRWWHLCIRPFVGTALGPIDGGNVIVGLSVGIQARNLDREVLGLAERIVRLPIGLLSRHKHFEGVLGKAVQYPVQMLLLPRSFQEMKMLTEAVLVGGLLKS